MLPDSPTTLLVMKGRSGDAGWNLRMMPTEAHRSHTHANQASSASMMPRETRVTSQKLYSCQEKLGKSDIGI